MHIENSHAQDIEMIFDLYDQAIAYQKTVFSKQWKYFERSLVAQEIAEHRQWKIMQQEEVMGIYAISFNDEQVWREKSADPAIYVHRIVTNPAFRGQGCTKIIIDWAKQYCRQYGYQYVRIDTWGDNHRLINYYQSCGFDYVETIILDQIEGLPAHYHGPLALLQTKG